VIVVNPLPQTAHSPSAARHGANQHEGLQSSPTIENLLLLCEVPARALLSTTTIVEIHRGRWNRNVCRTGAMATTRSAYRLLCYRVELGHRVTHEILAMPSDKARSAIAQAD
jgi:hypothetical protein